MYTQYNEELRYGAVESNEVNPQPPFLQNKQAKSPQLLLIGHAFQPFHQLCCPPLDAFKDLNILLKLWGPELHTVLQGTLLTHIEPAVNQHPQVPFCRAALQPLLSQSILVSSVTPSQVQNLAFVLIKFHAIDDCPMLQSIPLQGLLPLKRVNSTSQIGIISKLADGAFNPCIQIVDKNIEQDWP
ncbi:LOW QUALITY PROTEIN: hypothetical protein QYF61_027583 [Mycteria americana]|uniref:Uncharacterized protein n=1 Tax=Mycteria americana TaxID=33587 RepID=A0AAN7RLA2_MYCAM|nr:LOW QUALITY PROTEIN: hypothetical protein QYF61_027583 [Mycteria americana]